MVNLISDAEWQIMRIIWAKAPITSTEIIDELSSVTSWMPTTVKTLLSRLVNKNIISYESKGRTFYYSPLITEQACIENEMKYVVQKVYGGITHFQTAHFNFKGQANIQYASQLGSALESKYAYIVSTLQTEFDEPLSIYLHHSQMGLHSALGLMNGPKWLRAGYSWGLAHLAPPDCFDNIKPETAVLHIFVLMLVEKINASVPYWLQQGVATYLSGWITQERISEVVSSRLSTTKIQEFQVMHHTFMPFKEEGGYEIGFTVVDYIVRTYGIDHLSTFIQNPHNYKGIFNTTEDEFWEKWQSFINSYLSN